MNKTANGWNIIDAATPILTYRYSFGPAFANALAVGCDGGIMILSPPYKAAPGVLDDVKTFGAVRALVATNAFHHMGLRQWHEAFPEAPLFAPAQSIARVERKAGVRAVRPVALAAGIAGPHLELVDMPHYKTGEVLSRIETAQGLAWYVTDVIMNMTVLPKNFIAALAFRLTGSGPGLRYNNIAPLFMVADKQALRRWLNAEAAKKPPRLLIPAHGDIVDFAAQPDAARQLFAHS